MGNCQAIDAATLVVQHPNGKEEKFYWAVSAAEIMKMNPGHYVALLISTTVCDGPASNSNKNGGGGGDDNRHKDHNINNNNNKATTSVRLTRIKLLRPTDTLVLGQVYRLITTQEVMKGLWAKKQAKVKKRSQVEGEQPQPPSLTAPRRSEASELDKDNQVTKNERHRPRTSSATASRTWQPSLHSISEAAS